MALVYRGEHASTPLFIGDASWPAIYTAAEPSWNRRLAPVVEAHGTRSVETIWPAFTGFSTSTSWVHDCPASMQLVWQHDLVQTLGLDAEAERRMSHVGGEAEGREPIRIVVDTPESTAQPFDLGILQPHERRTAQGPAFDNYTSRYLGAVVASAGRPLPTVSREYTPHPWPDSHTSTKRRGT